MILFHAADIHLGRRRLDGRLPDSDFAAAFRFIADQAIAEKADAFLLAGDLFDRPQVDPPHLRQAEEVLSRLRQAGIPVIAITGNHDKAFVNSEEQTWLEYLADDELLLLLTTRFGPNGPIPEPWNPVTRRGSWFDLGGVRFTGAGYLGAATPHKLRQIVETMDPSRVHVLLLHAGPDYFVGEGGGFTKDDLQALRQKVTYLALGHIHKPMNHDGWACNPGSPENCDLQESLYDRDKTGAMRPRGFVVVQIDPTLARPLRKLDIRSNPRRPVLQLSLDCTPFGNKLKDGAAALRKAAVKLISENEAPADAAVSLRLTGKINLARLALDLQIVSQEIQAASNVAAVSLDATATNLVGADSVSGEGQSEKSREEIEHAAINQLVQDEHLWGLDAEQESIASLFFELKEGVRLSRSPDELAELIQSNPLIEKITAAARPVPAPAPAPLRQSVLIEGAA